MCYKNYIVMRIQDTMEKFGADADWDLRLFVLVRSGTIWVSNGIYNNAINMCNCILMSVLVQI